ncbi:unnamed protein product [Sympodiomycopsis kandeliae]
MRLATLAPIVLAVTLAYHDGGQRGVLAAPFTKIYMATVAGQCDGTGCWHQRADVETDTGYEISNDERGRRPFRPCYHVPLRGPPPLITRPCRSKGGHKG